MSGNTKDLDARAAAGETVVEGGTGGKSVQAQQNLAEGNYCMLGHQLGAMNICIAVQRIEESTGTCVERSILGIFLILCVFLILLMCVVVPRALQLLRQVTNVVFCSALQVVGLSHDVRMCCEL